MIIIFGFFIALIYFKPTYNYIVAVISQKSDYSLIKNLLPYK